MSEQNGSSYVGAVTGKAFPSSEIAFTGRGPLEKYLWAGEPLRYDEERTEVKVPLHVGRLLDRVHGGFIRPDGRAVEEGFGRCAITGEVLENIEVTVTAIGPVATYLWGAIPAQYDGDVAALPDHLVRLRQDIGIGG